MDTVGLKDGESHCFEVPKWLDILENRRKRPHRLAHDIGAGSPCLICKEKCKGLNLHFWRKICIECKCRKEDHDFPDEDEYPQMEILFGTKKVKKTTLRHNALNKTFDWVPQNISQELVIEYMNALPQSKLPISNTDGAIYRKQQLEKQLPVHDVDPNACHNLSDNEINEFEKYLQNLKKNIVGQGKIMKFENNNIRGESSLIDSISAKDSEKKKLPNDVDGHGVLVHDKCIEAKTIFSEKIDSQPYPAGNSPTIDIVNRNKINSEFLPHHLNVSGEFKSKYDGDKISNQSLDFRTISMKMTDFTVAHSTDLSNNAVKGDLAIKENRTPNSSLKLRNPASDNRNNNGNINFNTISDNENVEKLRKGYDVRNLAENLASSPLNIDNINKKIISMDLINDSTNYHKEPFPVNVMNASSYELPFIPIQESLNMLERETKGKHSWIVHDKSLPFNVGELSRSVEHKCLQCKEILQGNDVVVTTEHGGDSSMWHARCFVCHICAELLVDLMYFYHEGKVYCGRDYAKARNIPRCFACDELIFVKEYTRAEGESYHLRHFCCYHCDEPLAGKRYIPKDNQPVCLECYQNCYGKTCSSCLKPIPVADQRVSIGDYNFHVTEECFRCMNCSKFLKGERFILKNDKTFCSKECFLQIEQ